MEQSLSFIPSLSSTAIFKVYDTPTRRKSTLSNGTNYLNIFSEISYLSLMRKPE